jgi:hypothetical protein
MQSEKIDLLITALAIAQGEISPAPKSADNPFHKSKYANLTSVWEACRLHLSKNGIAVVQTLDESAGQMVLVTMLAHSSGQWIKSRVPILVGDKKTPQTIGSAITYMRRYSLAAIVGVAPEQDDDDGQAATIAVQKQETHQVVSLAQAKQLIDLYDQCTPEHKKAVLDNLKRAPTYVEGFYHVPQGMFERLVASAKKNIAENQLKVLHEVG